MWFLVLARSVYRSAPPHVLQADLADPVPQTIFLPCRLFQVRKVRQPGDSGHEPASALGRIADMRKLLVQLQRVQAADPGRGDHDGGRLVPRALLQLPRVQEEDRRVGIR